MTEPNRTADLSAALMEKSLVIEEMKSRWIYGHLVTTFEEVGIYNVETGVYQGA